RLARRDAPLGRELRLHQQAHARHRRCQARAGHRGDHQGGVHSQPRARPHSAVRRRRLHELAGGEVLMRWLLLVLVPVLVPWLALAERVTGTVRITKDGAPKADRSGVVIYLEGAPAPRSEARPRIMQKEQQFVPPLTVVTKGATVDFPNEDKIFHNVFSVSDPAKFDLGLYKGGDSKTVTFRRAGTVDVYCNIHPNMIAKIKVVDGPWAVTGPDGAFAIAAVPPGTYSIVAWQAYGQEWRGEVKVEPGATPAVAIELVEGKAEAGHQRKDGTPYGRYK